MLGWQSDALAPESFVGVNAPAHIAALEALYTEVNPEKLAQIPLMWDKFGAGIWQALVPKYPHVRPLSARPFVFMSYRGVWVLS